MKNPYAYVDRQLVAADACDRGLDFRCPNCSEHLILKRGDINVAHFAHKPNTVECDSDLIKHQIAMDLLCDSRNSFWWEYYCGGGTSYTSPDDMFCVGAECEEPPRKRWIRNSYTEQEYQIDKYRVDIAILNGNRELKGIIEVQNTHAVDEDKWKYIVDLNIPCIEVDSQSVIDANENSDAIKVIEVIRKHIPPVKCEGCNRAKKKAQVEYLKRCLPWLPKPLFRGAMKSIWKTPLLTRLGLVEEGIRLKRHYDNMLDDAMCSVRVQEGEEDEEMRRMDETSNETEDLSTPTKPYSIPLIASRHSDDTRPRNIYTIPGYQAAMDRGDREEARRLWNEYVKLHYTDVS